MQELDEFQQTRKVVEDFVAKSLSRLPGDFSRLLYVATLRDMGGGGYRHAGLETVYSKSVVDQALRLCHEELFARILEAPLESQELDLRRCFGESSYPMGPTAQRWSENQIYRSLTPSGVPSYLRELFCSNCGILLSIVAADGPTPKSIA